jgi:hypothetical protein
MFFFVMKETGVGGHGDGDGDGGRGTGGRGDGHKKAMRVILTLLDSCIEFSLVIFTNIIYLKIYINLLIYKNKFIYVFTTDLQYEGGIRPRASSLLAC